MERMTLAQLVQSSNRGDKWKSNHSYHSNRGNNNCSYNHLLELFGTSAVIDTIQ
jgi:hypothetical protein